MNDVLCDAICAQRILRFQYDGKVRVVEPHLVGETSSGHDVLFGWCRNAKAEELGDWRTFVLALISALEVLADTFPHPRPHYNPTGDKNLSKVYCALPQVFGLP